MYGDSGQATGSSRSLAQREAIDGMVLGRQGQAIHQRAGASGRSHGREEAVDSPSGEGQSRRRKATRHFTVRGEGRPPVEVDCDKVRPLPGRRNCLKTIPGCSEGCVDRSVIGPRSVYAARKERTGAPPARFNINLVVSKNDSRYLPWLGCRRYAL